MADIALKALLEEMLAPLGPVVIKRMFGGYGIFLDGVMFGLVSGAQLYFKTDEDNRPVFEGEGLGPFTYTKKGAAAVLTSYWQAPERLLDEPDELVDWARSAHRAAMVARSAKQQSSRNISRKPRT